MLFTTFALIALTGLLILAWLRNRRAVVLFDSGLAIALLAAMGVVSIVDRSFVVDHPESPVDPVLPLTVTPIPPDRIDTPRKSRTEEPQVPTTGDLDILPLVGGAVQGKLEQLQAGRMQPNLKRYRTNEVDPRVQNVPPDLQERAMANPDRDFARLVQYLTDGVNDPFLRAKIIHDWIAYNIAYDVDYSFDTNRTASAPWRSTLQGGKSVCSGYAALLAKMCKMAGIPCKEVAGFSRENGYDFYVGEDVTQSNHCWNAVQIDRQWYLVDATWDAGVVSGGEFERDFNHTYFLLDPSHFLFTHFPTEPEWQLLDAHLTAEEYSQLPDLRGSFFDAGLQLLTPLARLNHARDTTQFVVQVPRDMTIDCQLEGPNGEDLERRVFVQRQGDRCLVSANFPYAGPWKLVVFWRHRDDLGSFSLAGKLDFVASRGTSRRFPRVYTTYHDLDGALVSPLFTPLEPGRRQTFKIRLLGADEVHLVTGEKWRRFSSNPTQRNVYELDAEISENEVMKLVAKTHSGRKHLIVIDFSAE